ncbi:MAG TPA: 4'-phosphopantetheinyl transferase superfamily protein [Steroidobacteraceae bacterium]
MRELAADEVHLWVTFDESIRSESLLAAYRQLLTEDERQKEMRFRFGRDQRQYLVTRALVRTVLSQYCDIPPEAWRFASDERGRPYVIDAGEDVPQFNLSHTPGLILCGVTRARAIGVDAENLQSARNSTRVAERHFSPQEVEDLKALPVEEQAERFLHYWTLKEAYIKARGAGLAMMPLTRFGFTFPGPGRLDVAFGPEIEDAPGHWKFWLLQPSAVQVAAVCAARESSRPTRLTLRRVVPLESEHSFECPILRESADVIA